MIAVAGCGGAGTTASPVDDGGPVSPGGDAGGAAPPNDASADAAPTDGASPSAPRVLHTVITGTHRAIPGQMFGGWGPHLGHLVRRAGGELWFVDDACEATGPTACDVNVNRRVDAFSFDEGTRTFGKRGAVALSGVQQNTATIARGGVFHTYGVDTAQSRLTECTLDPAAVAAWACRTIPIALPAQTNYVGAAVSPEGHKLVWATTVSDGGGGTFHWFADYGGGFNGPRTGAVGGFNDASYAHASFLGGAQKGRFVLHAQLVGGLAPNWTFHAAVADGDVGTANAVAFTLLAGAAGDPLVSTNDVLVDPLTNDAHLLARSRAGDAVYLFRPSGGPWSGPLAVFPKSFRARLSLLASGHLAVVHQTQRGVAVKLAPRTARAPGAPADWSAAALVPLALPAGYEAPIAIYTEEATYQGAAPPAVSFALVGKNEREVLYVRVDP